MTLAIAFQNAPDLSAEDYLVLGLATCFLKEESDIHEVEIIEPIPSAAIEAILKGIPTSYQMAYGTTLGAVLDADEPKPPAGFPADAQFCDDFTDRAIAAARTYKAKPVSQKLIPLNTTYTELNHSTERKRVLNSERIVKTEDNVKQHSHTHQVL
jgi:hypothetical protein